MIKPALQYFICLAFIFSSCNISDLEFENIKNPTYSPSIAVKLGSASYTIKELVDDIEDEQLEINEGSDFSLSFIYRDTTEFDVSDDFIKIPTIENSLGFAGGNTLPATPIEVVLPVSEILTFDYDAADGELIDSVFYSGGNLDFEIRSDFGGVFNFTWTIINMKEIATDQDLSDQISGSSVANFNRPLLGLKSLISNSSGKNEFQLKIDGTITIPKGTAVVPSQQLTIAVKFTNPSFSSIFGNFGTKTVDIANQTIDMAGFEEFGESGLELNDPRITLEIDNSYGITMGTSLAGMVAINNDGTELALTGDIITDGVNINGASHLNVGGFVTSVIEINKTNSNINELLNSTPTSMIFPVTATLNPASSTLETNFLQDNSKIIQRTIVEIPLDVKMDGFSREFDFDISDIEIEDATSLSIRIITKNEIPFTGTVDLQFLDLAGNILHTIDDEKLFVAPAVDANGRTIAPLENIEDIVLDQAGIDALIASDKVNVILRIDSFDAANGTFVKIFSDYKLEFELSLTGSISIDL